jgi:hypothetical protein
VGHDDERRVLLRLLRKQKIHDLLAGRFIEIAGRLVGKNERGLGRKRTRERDPLLFAARKLRRIMMNAGTQADAFKFAFSALERVGAAGKFERHRDVFERGHGRDQMEGLKYDPDRVAAKARELVFVELGELPPRDLDRTRIRALQACDHHQKRRFARSRRADQSDRLTLANLDRHFLEDMNARGA